MYKKRCLLLLLVSRNGCVRRKTVSDLCVHPITGVYVCIHHQMEMQAEEQAAEAQKERKLRERNEQYSRQLEEELEGLKVRVQTYTAEQ